MIFQSSSIPRISFAANLDLVERVLRDRYSANSYYNLRKGRKSYILVFGFYSLKL